MNESTHLMNRLFLFPFTLVMLAVSCGMRPGELTSNVPRILGQVWSYGFEVERITGLLKSEIESYGGRFVISSKDFEECIVSGAESGKTFRERDIRAKVAFDSVVYYLDRKGVAQGSDGSLFLVDVSCFSKMIVPSADGGEERMEEDREKGSDPEVSPQIRPGPSLGEQRIMVTRNPLLKRPDGVDQPA